ncbi:MAG: ComEA family DNA-binding protein [Chloroflexi bacterium]|nr:ComEA family DNA-binding protein [Chloroflexota bacterium]
MSALGALKGWLRRYGGAVALALVALAIVAGGIAFLTRFPDSHLMAIVNPTSPQESTLTPSKAGVNINTASARELETLPDIGPVLAGRIVQYRDEHGPFQRIEDILDVQGIGPATFNKLKDSITVGP